MINLFIYYLKKFLPRKDRISSNFQYRHYLFNELIENIDTSNFDLLKESILSNSISLVLVGPEIPLIHGISDFISNESFNFFKQD